MNYNIIVNLLNKVINGNVEGFSPAVNIKTALAAAAANVLLLYLLNITNPVVLGVAAVFGITGGSLIELVTFARNNKINADRGDEGGVDPSSADENGYEVDGSTPGGKPTN